MDEAQQGGTIGMTSGDEYQWQIEQLLQRRTDLSTFVIHWTRSTEDGNNGRENLLSMLEAQTIYARTPMGAAVRPLRRLFEEGKLTPEEQSSALSTQQVVCFTEAPLEQAWSFVSPIAGRRQQLEPFGLAFTKLRARQLAVNPVWYVDMTPGHDWLIHHVEKLVVRAAQTGCEFADDPVAKIAPFVEVMGTWEGSRKEFWWEREWRHHKDLHFCLDDIAVVLCREEDMDQFTCYTKCDSGRTVPRIDPNWGLERIIATLAGVPTS